MSTHSESYLDLQYGSCVEPSHFFNITGPIIITASWVNIEHQSILETLLSSMLYQDKTQRFKPPSLQRMYSIIGALERMQAILKHRSNAPAFILDCRFIEAKEISLIGLDFVISQKQLSIAKSLRAHITEVMKRDTLINPMNSNENFTVAKAITYLYARAIRYEWLKIYNQRYPQMNLLTNLGVATKDHTLALALCSHLPPFYIWDRAIKTIQGDKASREVVEKLGSNHWLHKELNTVNQLPPFDL